MFFYDNVNELGVKKLHIEPTNRCNSRCPHCPRTNSISIKNSGIKELTLDLIKKINISRLTHVFMCGNYGDPILCDEIYDICDYFKDYDLNIDTNGSIRSSDWWGKLGKLFANTNSRVTFALDGLKDTNSIYRIGTDWDKIMDNVKSYISAGGNAGWQFLIFDHNKDQVEEARELSKSLGFKTFKLKRAIRRTNDTSIKFVNSGWASLENVYKKKKEVICRASKNNKTYKFYISCDGDVLPCCHWGGAYFPYKYKEIENCDFAKVVSDIDISLHTNSWENIVNAYQIKSKIMKEGWSNNDLPTCVTHCGTTKRDNNIVWL